MAASFNNEPPTKVIITTLTLCESFIMALSGKTALICGGAKNLGAQVALELASAGASLALHYNSEKTKASADELSAVLVDKWPNVKFQFYTGDLTSGGPVEKLFNDVVRDFGGIDIVVNTVGMVLKKPFVDITEKELDTMFAYVDLAYAGPCILMLTVSTQHQYQGRLPDSTARRKACQRQRQTHLNRHSPPRRLHRLLLRLRRLEGAARRFHSCPLQRTCGSKDQCQYNRTWSYGYT